MGSSLMQAIVFAHAANEDDSNAQEVASGAGGHV